MKKTLNNYKYVKGLIVAGVVIPVALVIVNLGYNNFNTNSDPQITPTQEASEDYNGTYTGNTKTTGGLANVTVNVINGVLDGEATYIGEYQGFDVTAPAKIEGTVSESGAVSASVTVTGKQYGQTISLSGPTNGQITDGVMTCSYSISGNFGEFSGEILLNKI